MNKTKWIAIGAVALVLIAAVALGMQPKENQVAAEGETSAMAAAEGIVAEPGEEAGQNAEAMPQKEAATEANTSGNDISGNAEADEPKQENIAGHNEEGVIPEENIEVGVAEGSEDKRLPDEEIEDNTVQIVTPSVTQPAVDPVEETLPADFDIFSLTYEQYNAMSGAQQKLVIEMFGSAEDFMRWYRAVEAKYKAEHPNIEIGDDGVIDAEDLIK